MINKIIGYIKKIFGETKEDQKEFLQERVPITLVTCVAILICYCLNDILPWFIPLLCMAVIFYDIFVVWGIPSVKRIFHIVSVGAVISNNGVVAIILLLVYFFIAFYVGIFFAVVGVIVYLYDLVYTNKDFIKEALSNKKITSLTAKSTIVKKPTNKKSKMNNPKSNKAKIDSSQPDNFYIVNYRLGQENAQKLLSLANKGDLNSILEIAKAYFEEGEHSISLQWFDKAAKQDSAEAYYYLNMLYADDYEEVEQDIKLADYYLNKSIQAKYPPAIFSTGEIFEDGIRRPQNLKSAFQCYVAAAKLNYDPAKEVIGRWYYNGKYVKQDYSLAAKWFAQCKDYKYGYFDLATCFINGHGVAQDYNKATICLERAIKNNCKEIRAAKKKLLELYNEGYGTGDIISKRNELKYELDNQRDIIGELAQLIMEENNDKDKPSDDTNITVLTMDDGTTESFEILDIIEYKETEYAVLLPIDTDENEVYIFNVTIDKDGREIYSSVSDDISDEIYNIFKEKGEYDFE